MGMAISGVGGRKKSGCPAHRTHAGGGEQTNPNVTRVGCVDPAPDTCRMKAKLHPELHHPNLVRNQSLCEKFHKSAQGGRSGSSSDEDRVAVDPAAGAAVGP
jgi:hypothetical protein